MGSIQDFAAKVLRWEDIGVDLARSGIVSATLWGLTLIAGLEVAQNPFLWVAVAVSVFVIFGVLGSGTGDRPKIVGHVHRPAVGSDKPEGGDKYALVCLVSVSNQGAPTSLRDWYLELQPPGKKEWHRLPTGIVGGAFNAIAPSGLYTETYGVADHISNKTMTPIVKGQSVSGYILSELADFTESIFKKGEVGLRLTCRDVWGKTHILSEYRGEFGGPGDDDPMSIPGLSTHQVHAGQEPSGGAKGL